MPRSGNPEDVAVHKDVVVGKAGGRNLLADLYVPTAAAGLHPAIVVVHGGGWRKGRPESVRGFGELLGRAGFVCLLASYRLSMEAIWPAQIEDVKCAIRFLRAEFRLPCRGSRQNRHRRRLRGWPSCADGGGIFLLRR